MRLNSVVFLFFFLLFAGRALAEPQVFSNLEPIQSNDRILILAPHPDDETIACAGVIQEAKKAGAEIKIAYLTNGEHNEFAFIVYKKELILFSYEFIQMGQMRKREAAEAMRLFGIGEDNLAFLGYPDFGTFDIFSCYWQSNKSFCDMLTRISRVPYKGTLSYDAPYTGESILADLKSVILEYRPTKIFVSHPADVNVDHKSLYLFTEVALEDLRNEITRPKVYPYLVHRVGWPLPRHYHPELTLEPPNELLKTSLRWESLQLSPERLEKKHQAILAYKSQTASSAFYLLSFARKNELFSAYPEINLAVPISQKSPVEDWLYARDRMLGILRIFQMPERKQTNNAIAPYITSEDGPVNYGLDRDALLVCVKISKNAKQRIAIALYLFGYSYDKPFAKMPKIHITSKYNNLKVFNAGKEISSEGAVLELTPGQARFRIPLRLLGDPDFILTSTRAYTGKLPIQQPGFRKINIVKRSANGIQKRQDQKAR